MLLPIVMMVMMPPKMIMFLGVAGLPVVARLIVDDAAVRQPIVQRLMILLV